MVPGAGRNATLTLGSSTSTGPPLTIVSWLPSPSLYSAPTWSAIAGAPSVTVASAGCHRDQLGASPASVTPSLRVAAITTTATTATTTPASAPSRNPKRFRNRDGTTRVAGGGSM